MKKLSTFIILLFLFTSCVSKEEQLKEELKETFQKDVVSRFNDPYSFKEEDCQITDTVFVKEIISEKLILVYDNLGLELKEIDLNELKKSNNVLYDVAKKEYDLFKIEKDSLNNLYKTIPSDSIDHINFEYIYRTKNGFGGLVRIKHKVKYYPETRKFNFDNNWFLN
jgi:hypothetical protein